MSAQTLEEIEHKSSVKYAGGFDVFLLGITIVIGGQVFSWNASLQAGFWEAFLGMVLTGLGYIVYVCCIAEMTSALPFSGGSYGYARVCLGPYFGFLVGCCEAMQNIAYVSSAAVPLAWMFSIIFHSDSSYEPAFFVFFYVSAVAVNIIGGNVFWWFCRIIGVISLIITVLYIVGTSYNGDFAKFSESRVADYAFSGNNFVKFLPLCAWYYIGVESLPLACVDCNNPARELPFGMVLCVIVLFLTAVGVFFTSVSQSPGIEELGTSFLPMNYGFQKSFGWNYDEVTWLALPASYATGFGFIFMYGRQMCSMSRSGLLPKFLQHRTKAANSPHVALMVGSVISVFALLVVYFTDVTYLNQVFYVCVLSSYSTNVAVLLCFFIFRKRYAHLNRPFVSPFGYAGAVYGILVYSLGMISILGFQADQIPLIIMCIYLSVLTVYYYFYGFQAQKLSEEEQKVLFKAYVINVNVTKRKGAKTGTNSLLSSNRSNNQENSTSVSAAAKSRSRVQSATVVTEESVNLGSPGKGGVPTTPRSHHTATGATANINNARLSAEPMVLDPIPLRQQLENRIGLKAAEISAPEPVQGPSSQSLLTMSLKSNRVWSDPKPSAASTKVTDHVTASQKSAASAGSVSSSTGSARLHSLRHSITQGISEKIKEIVQDFKMVSFMDEEERVSYEALVLADMCGALDQNESTAVVEIPPFVSNKVTPLVAIPTTRIPDVDDLEANHQEEVHARETVVEVDP